MSYSNGSLWCIINEQGSLIYNRNIKQLYHQKCKQIHGFSLIWLIIFGRAILIKSRLINQKRIFEALKFLRFNDGDDHET